MHSCHSSRSTCVRESPRNTPAKIGDMVYRAMRETINIPEHDRFQVITDHPADGLVYDSSYLGINRTDDVVFIQIHAEHEADA